MSKNRFHIWMNWRLLFIVGVVCGIGTRCSAAPKIRHWHEAGVGVTKELAILDNVMKEFMVRRDISAGALAVTYQSRLVFAKGYTWAYNTDDLVRPNSLFRIASLSKSVTAAAILHLVQEGKLKLNEQVADVIEMSPAEGQEADKRLGKVTILYLLQHLGGWDRGKSFDPMFQDARISKELGVELPIRTADIIRFMGDKPLQHEPGTTYAYSNYGYCLLGRVIEKRSGMAYEAYVKQNILTPLGITRMRLGHSSYDERAPGEVRYTATGQSPYGTFNLENMDAHGGWLASAIELVRFATAFDKPENCKILSKKLIERMYALPENLSDDTYKAGDPYYACGWNVRDYGKGQRNTWHSGSLPGTYTFMARWRSGIDCVVLFNKRGTGFNQIDPILNKAIHSIRQWPSGDYFEKMLSDPDRP